MDGKDWLQQMGGKKEQQEFVLTETNKQTKKILCDGCCYTFNNEKNGIENWKIIKIIDDLRIQLDKK